MKRQQPAKIRTARSIRAALPAVAILLLGILAVLVFLVYRVSYPGGVPEAVNPSYYQLPFLEALISSKHGKDIAGWWIPGLKGAPGIVLAPGYGMSRSDALSLAAALHESGFNLLVFGQRGSSYPPRGASTFGLLEIDDMLCALGYLQERPESNKALIGIWGVDVGAFAALRAATSINEVRAIAADGAFGSALDFLDLMIREEFGIEFQFLRFGCRQVFGLFNLSSILSIEERYPLQALAGRAILFVQGENRSKLGPLTAALYNQVAGQKETVRFKTSRIHLMSGEELKSYDSQVAGFFKRHLYFGKQLRSEVR